ncbi:MAG: iron ABC transporter permease [Alphaproteobacteria bacterium]|nr:iron ABC transporter permease [Alphaproteobacteria bacterium]
MTGGARLTLALAALTLVAIAAAMLIGAAPIPVSRLAAALIGQGAPADVVVLWEIRAPRALAAALVGAALGASGAALQGLLRNPLADPGVLGVSATASLFGAAALYFGLVALAPLALPIAAIAGALASIVLLLGVARRAAGPASLILAGVGVSAFAGALMSLLLALAPTPFTLSDLVNWSLGSVANRSLEDIAFAAPFLLAGAFALARAAPALSALTLGEDAAASLGADLALTRALTVAGAGLLTGAAVALAGAVGFVGLVAPHLVRAAVRHDPARVIVPAAWLGAAMLVLADIVARVAPTDTELKLGVIAALVGAPAFLFIAARTGVFDD